MFRKIIPILLIGLIAWAGFFGYNYATGRLERFISKFSQENFDANISVGSVGIGLPFCLELKDVRIDDSISVKKVCIYPNPTSFLLKGKLIVSSVKIIDPFVRIKQKSAKSPMIPDFLKKKEKSSGSHALGFYFSDIRVKNGALIYDRESKGILEFVKINGKIKGSAGCFSKDNVFEFAGIGFLKNKDSDFLSPLKIDGFFGSDGIVKTKLQAFDLKLETFGSISGRYLSRLVKEGRVDLKSDVEISKKRMVARCLIEGDSIVLKKKPEEKIDTPIVASFILLVNFKSKLVKIKNLEGNFLRVILGR
ncbi:hypothetical protein KKB41_04190 [Patescibacteria group bacterium]|nr:hypothetical protein [Patescibacteria group bacterium]